MWGDSGQDRRGPRVSGKQGQEIERERVQMSNVTKAIKTNQRFYKMERKKTKQNEK